MEPFDDVDTLRVRQIQVDERDVRDALASLLHGLRRGRAQSRDHEALALEERPDADTHHGMVLDAEDPERPDIRVGLRRGRLREGGRAGR